MILRLVGGLRGGVEVLWCLVLFLAIDVGCRAGEWWRRYGFCEFHIPRGLLLNASSARENIVIIWQFSGGQMIL